jgi:hypothetical protein
VTETQRQAPLIRHGAHTAEEVPPTAPEGNRDTHLLAVMSVSAGMVGACLTAIGLIGVLRKLSSAESIVDDFLALSTLFFTTSALLSFVAMRTRVGKRLKHIVRTIDVIFCVGLVLTFLATLLLTWVVI